MLAQLKDDQGRMLFLQTEVRKEGVAWEAVVCSTLDLNYFLIHIFFNTGEDTIVVR